jgi:serine/threonine protein kinase
MIIPGPAPTPSQATPGAGTGFLVKVLDFGIAKLRPEHMAQEATIVRTQSGQLLGTPNYMAPEQCQSSQPQTDKVDVYALGTVMFRCLAGRTPFVTDGRGDAGLMHLCAQQIGEPPPPVRQFAPEVPEEIAELLASTLRKSADKRPSMRQFADRLADLQRRGIGSSVHRGSSDDLPTINQPLHPGSDLATGQPGGPADRPSIPGNSYNGTAKVQTGKGRLRWWHVGAGLVVLGWFAALLWWSLASP